MARKLTEYERKRDFETTSEPAPNFFTQVWDFVVHGRNYIDLVAKNDEQILAMRERKFLFFFTFTDLRGSSGGNELLAEQHVRLTADQNVYHSSFCFYHANHTPTESSH